MTYPPPASRTQTPQTSISMGGSGGQPMSPQANAYLRNRVLTASPEELRLMLLDGAIKFAYQGREGMVAKNFEQMYLGISQCRNIIFELLTTIRDDVNPPVAKQMKGLYTFMYTQLLEASHEKDPAKVSRVIELLEYDRETWALLMQKLAEERLADKSAPASGSTSNSTSPLNSAPATAGTIPSMIATERAPLSLSA
jgi:flagellar secretion chaperone FliS